MQNANCKIEMKKKETDRLNSNSAPSGEAVVRIQRPISRTAISDVRTSLIFQWHFFFSRNAAM